MKTSDFDYHLPPELIAQTPIEPRDGSRMMVINRRDGTLQHRNFYEIVDLLDPGDVLVLNESRVIPARLTGYRGSGGKVEILLLRRLEPRIWEALVQPSGRIGIGETINIVYGSAPVPDCPAPVEIQVLEDRGEGLRIVRFDSESLLEAYGDVPLPPYIHTSLRDPERYQTVYAKENGSVAAPTAGLHLTPQLLLQLRERNVELAFVTLHVGLDTFRPIRVADPTRHRMHSEYGEIDLEAANTLSAARSRGGRIVCVGTTTVRLLEQAAQEKAIEPFKGETSLFIVPGHRFRMVDCLITNFHLPRSTLLMLVSAFTGQDLIRKAYQEAIQERYRFYSFGDCMMIC